MGNLLEGKRALVTSVQMYMGEPIAKVLEEEGAEVISSDADLTTPNAAKELIDNAGPIDILVANLAESSWWEALVQNIDDAEWDRYFNEIVHPLMRVVRAVSPQMIERKAGKIIAITSAAPLRGIPKASGYCAARGAQNAFVRSAGIELARNNIQFNAIAQNYVENITYYPPEMLADTELVKRMVKVIPAKRLGKGEETGHLAAFLASDKSDFIVGQIIPFAGGWVTST
ncbi:MAG: short-chain dehydrogenase [Candidatus Hydrogenedentota bacterium]|nr:MAG: short-chain dehydrogenase [Candidatus Hydrogenedentota bacterium]